MIRTAGTMVRQLRRKAALGAAGLAIVAGSLVGLSQPASAATGCNPLMWDPPNRIVGTCYGTGYVKFSYTCVNAVGGTYAMSTGWYYRPMSFSIPVSCYVFLGTNYWPKTSSPIGYTLG